MKKAFWINKLTNDTAEIYLYGLIFNSEEFSTEEFVKELKALGAQYNKVKIRINSGGGSVDDGIAIINAIKELGDKVEVHVDGLAASMAFVIAMSAPKCYMNKYGRLMSHRVKGRGFGNADDLRSSAEQCEMMDKTLAELISAKTGLSIEQTQAKYLTTVDKYIMSKEAFEDKIVDGTYEGVKVEVKANNKEKELVNQYYEVLQNCIPETDQETLIII